MLTANDYTDIGTLIAFALQPNKRPSGDDYRRTLTRYRAEPAFRVAVDGILSGLSVQVLSDGDFGLILGVSSESPFAFRVGDMPRTQEPEGRLLAALVLVGLAAFAYPSAEELDEERVRQVNDVEFEEWLRVVCKGLETRDAAGEVIPQEGLDHAWRVYADMPATLVGDRNRGGSRLSAKSTLYWVRNTIGWLAEHGMARPDNTTGEGHWFLTERFRVQVKYMGAGHAYEYLRDLHRTSISASGGRSVGTTSGFLADQKEES
ncbi:hypothetical protein QFZ35_003869 [Arthrobacter ulcerisalmonis]|nr:hypothetical protein [Arthrobacter ulcerisalmonis]MDQ0665371.1 hypothetical protein [Arthrobacter ulcerisalmonis]